MECYCNGVKVEKVNVEYPGIKQTLAYIATLETKIRDQERIISGYQTNSAKIEIEFRKSKEESATLRRMLSREAKQLKKKDTEISWRQSKIETLEETINEYKIKIEKQGFEIQDMEHHKAKYVVLKNKLVDLTTESRDIKLSMENLLCKNKELQEILENERKQRLIVEEEYSAFKNNQDHHLKVQLETLRQRLSGIMNFLEEGKEAACLEVELKSSAEHCIESSRPKDGDKEEIN